MNVDQLKDEVQHIHEHHGISKDAPWFMAGTGDGTEHPIDHVPDGAAYVAYGVSDPRIIFVLPPWGASREDWARVTEEGQ